MSQTKLTTSSTNLLLAKNEEIANVISHGFGFLGGPGETQIEADKRQIGIRINKIKKELSRVVRTRSLHRKARKRVPYTVVALVGYTNAGKSTLFNLLTGAEVKLSDCKGSSLNFFCACTRKRC